MPAARLILLALATLALAGCVQRTISITSEPAGALVWLNDREVGRTPLEVEFLTYGTYDVRLTLEGHEPLLTSGRADAPWWDWPGFDLLAAAAPFELHSHVEWHYEMEPARNEPEPLLDRARGLREQMAAENGP